MGKQVNTGQIDLTKLVLSIITMCGWFVGAIIYLVVYWNKIGFVEKVTALIAIICPVVPGAILVANSILHFFPEE